MERAVKILAIADLHGRREMLSRLKVEDIDLITVSGDLHNLESEPEARAVVDTLAALSDSGAKVLVVPGNMDPKQFCFRLWEEAGFTLLHNRAFRLPDRDIGMIGFGGIVARGSRKPGDRSRFYHREEDVYSCLKSVHKEISSCRTRIVITHQPPQGFLDLSFDGEVTGCAGLRRFVEEFSPHLLLCGHIHEARGQAVIGKTLAVNVGELRKGHSATIEISAGNSDDGIGMGIQVVWNKSP